MNMRPFHLELERPDVAGPLTAVRGCLAAPPGVALLEPRPSAPPPLAGVGATVPADGPAFVSPRVLCGRCHHEIDELPIGPYVRCPLCARRVEVPRHVHLRCAQCGRSHAIRPEELRVERLCANCGRPLPVGPIVLLPRRRQHVAHAPRHRAGAHGDAAWAVLIVGLTVLICVLSLTVL